MNLLQYYFVAGRINGSKCDETYICTANNERHAARQFKSAKKVEHGKDTEVTVMHVVRCGRVRPVICEVKS